MAKRKILQLNLYFNIKLYVFYVKETSSHSKGQFPRHLTSKPTYDKQQFPAECPLVCYYI